MRTKNSFINVITGWGTQFIKIVAGFLARTIFIKYLTVEYLGLNSTFSNILQLLSFAELGIGSAILVGYFRPIAKNDDEAQIALFQLSKKIYRIIGIVIAVVGILFTPFLDFFIKEIPDIPYISFIYILFVLNSAISYFTVHKSTYFTAVQKNYVIRLTHSAVYILMLICQCIILVLTQNYILYLLVQIAATVVENVLWSVLIRHQYPFLLVKTPKKLDGDDKKTFFINVKSVVYFKIGSVIVNTTDNLVLSKFMGLSIAGIYSNYYMIITAIDSILNQIFTAMTASVGDFHVTSDEKKQKDIFEKIMFLGFCLYAVSVAVLFGTLNDVIKQWLGEDFLFSLDTVVVLVLTFYVNGFRKVLSMFKEACGLFQYTKYITIAEAAANFILSVVLVKELGVVGIFLGTIFSFLMFGFWKEPLVIYKHVFQTSVWYYWKKYALYTVVLSVMLAVTWGISNLIQVDGWISLAFKVVMLGILNVILLGLMFCKTSELRYFLDMARKIWGKLRGGK